MQHETACPDLYEHQRWHWFDPKWHSMALFCAMGQTEEMIDWLKKWLFDLMLDELILWRAAGWIDSVIEGLSSGWLTKEVILWLTHNTAVKEDLIQQVAPWKADSLMYIGARLLIRCKADPVAEWPRSWFSEWINEHKSLTETSNQWSTQDFSDWLTEDPTYLLND